MNAYCSHTFLLFLPTFTHLFTVLSHSSPQQRCCGLVLYMQKTKSHRVILGGSLSFVTTCLFHTVNQMVNHVVNRLVNQIVNFQKLFLLNNLFHHIIPHKIHIHLDLIGINENLFDISIFCTSFFLNLFY